VKKICEGCASLLVFYTTFEVTACVLLAFCLDTNLIAVVVLAMEGVYVAIIVMTIIIIIIIIT
jgi:hypothetical protein